MRDSAASLAERELFSRHDVELISCSHASRLSSQCCSWCCACSQLLSQVDSTYQLLLTTSDWLAGCGLSIGSVLEDGVDDAAFSALGDVLASTADGPVCGSLANLRLITAHGSEDSQTADADRIIAA